MCCSPPTTVCAIAAVAVIGPGLGHLILILSLLWWTKYARLTRNLLFKIKTSEYITEAQLGSENDFRILTRYILPNILPEIVVLCAGHRQDAPDRGEHVLRPVGPNAHTRVGAICSPRDGAISSPRRG